MTSSATVDVSVLTPSLGYGRFVEDSILSVLHQEGVSTQHVIQDAGSTDGTMEVLRRYGRTVEWRSEQDHGQSDALNRALRNARGRWIAWLNADEFYLPGGLAELVRHGDSTAADIVYGDNVFVDEEGRLSRLLPPHPFNLRILRLYGCFIPSSSTIFRRSSLPTAPWDPDVKMMMDWDLYLQLASNGARFDKVDYPVGAFRRHRTQVTARPSTEFREEYARLFVKHGIDPARRRWGTILHRGSKLVSGAYVRQMRASRFQGRDVRWFRSDVGRETFDALLRACYDRTPSGTRKV